MTTKPILLATDFSQGGQAAQSKAIELARTLGSDLIALHVWAVPILISPFSLVEPTPDLLSAVEAGAQQAMNQTVTDIKASGVNVRGIVKSGDAWRTIVETAREVDAQMIVIGTHGRRGVPRMLLGSVAEKVVRTASCPVLTVHGERNEEPTSGG